MMFGAILAVLRSLGEAFQSRRQLRLENLARSFCYICLFCRHQALREVFRRQRFREIAQRKTDNSQESSQLAIWSIYYVCGGLPVIFGAGLFD
jgi:hypothetical protein